MKRITQSQKAMILSVLLAAAISGLLWAAFQYVGELESLRPMINRQPIPFWLSLFLLFLIGFYLTFAPTKIDDE